MASLFGLIRRNWLTFYPPEPPKAENALRFGILGAANIAPAALIRPAKSHPEVVVQAVAARDRKKAEAYAKKHGIPQVFDSYAALLDDPAIDAVYVPLPNGLHFEWTLRALAKGKHVLLEKPAVSNATEAELLFHSPLFQEPDAPVLLEAFHYRFQPAWHYFLSLVDRPNLAAASATVTVPAYLFGKDDIRWRYDLAGGNMMDLGTYPFSALRDVFGAAPEACLSCTVRKCPPPHELCDAAATARFRFPGGLVGEAHCDLQGTSYIPGTPLCRVEHKPVPAPLEPNEKKSSIPDGYERVRVRRLALHNFILSGMYHRIEIEDEFVVRRADKPDDVHKRWRKTTTKKAYTFKDAGVDQPGEDWWLSYRHQLEQFVNRIRKREGSGLWVGPEDSLAQSRMIDLAYQQTDLPLRPTSAFRLDAVPPPPAP